MGRLGERERVVMVLVLPLIVILSSGVSVSGTSVGVFASRLPPSAASSEGQAFYASALPKDGGATGTLSQDGHKYEPVKLSPKPCEGENPFMKDAGLDGCLPKCNDCKTIMFEYISYNLDHPAIQAANPTPFIGFCDDRYDHVYPDQKKRGYQCKAIWYQMRHVPYRKYTFEDPMNPIGKHDRTWLVDWRQPPALMNLYYNIDMLVTQGQSRVNSAFAESGDGARQRMIYVVNQICVRGNLCQD